MNFNAHKETRSSPSLKTFIRYFVRNATFENEAKYARSAFVHTWSFDDAHYDLLKISDEYFNPLGITFRFFVCPQLIDEYSAGNIEYVRMSLQDRDAKLLDWTDIKYLISCGHKLGSHGLDHKHFSSLTKDQIKRQFTHSHQLLHQRTGVKVDTFAFPFGRVDVNNTFIFTEGFKTYRKLYLSDNRIMLNDSGGLVNRRHAEIGPEFLKGLLAGNMNIFGLKVHTHHLSSARKSTK